VVKEINSKELESKLAANEELYLLDIRSEAEIAGGVLPHSTHLPMHLIPLKMNEFSGEKDIVLYCRSGARSYHACMYLMQQGFSNVVNLQGGIIDWARNGYSIVAYG
jgi:rhodanese-related sulfurtransferase